MSFTGRNRGLLRQRSGEYMIAAGLNPGVASGSAPPAFSQRICMFSRTTSSSSTNGLQHPCCRAATLCMRLNAASASCETDCFRLRRGQNLTIRCRSVTLNCRILREQRPWALHLVRQATHQDSVLPRRARPESFDTIRYTQTHRSRPFSIP